MTYDWNMGMFLSTDQWLYNLIKNYEHKQDPIGSCLLTDDTFLDPVDKSNPVIDSILSNGRYIVPDMVDTRTNAPIHDSVVDTRTNAPIHDSVVDTRTNAPIYDSVVDTRTNAPIYDSVVDTRTNAPIHVMVDTSEINYEQYTSAIESSNDDTREDSTKNLKIMDMLNNRQQKLINKLLCKSINPYVDYRSMHPCIKHGIYSYFKVHKYSSMKEITRTLNISHYALHQILQIFDLTWDRNKRCLVMT
jgi:hypothetical protein